jgi:C4-dicarboxylate-specific signal transduction histidine kinase
MPYISAWREDAREIWYEFVSERFTRLLRCEAHEAAAVFQGSVLDRRVYRHGAPDKEIRREVLNRRALEQTRKELRRDVKEKGRTDAVYKISLREGKAIWLKDLATVEVHEQDRISLSMGCLTVVSKEMKAEEERVRRERLQVSLEMAGAVCHEMNQPLQGINGYAETLMEGLPPGDPVGDKAGKILELARRMGEITGKLRKITRYQSKDYVQGVKITDLDRSSR